MASSSPMSEPPRAPGTTRQAGGVLAPTVAAAVAAALPVGLLYAVAMAVLASPYLNGIEALEHGHATSHATPLWGLLSGALAIATGLALVITPLCRLWGAPSGRRTWLSAALLCGVAFAVLSLRAGAVPPLPGAAAQELVTHLRAGALTANLVLCLGLAITIPVALRRLAP